MNFKEYQDTIVLPLEKKFDQIEVNPAMLELVIKIAVYSAALVEQVKKHIVAGKDIPLVDRDKIISYMTECLEELWSIRTRQQIITQKVPIEADPRLLHAALGISGEAGEVLLEVYDSWFNKKPVDVAKTKKELGDMNWYQALAIDALGTTLDEVLDINAAKLQSRYKSGRFSEEQAINRDLDAEDRAIEAANNA